MGYTDNCDIFASVHEDAINNVIANVKRQRPSLFNYATAEIVKNKLLCEAILAHPIVALRGNPLVTIVDPIPIFGTNYGLNFALQLVDVKLEFHPGNVIPLPSELNPPLQAQRLAINIKICGGICCPPADLVDRVIPPPVIVEPNKPKNNHEKGVDNTTVPITPIPCKQPICFCLDTYAIGGIRTATYSGIPFLEPFLNGLEIVNIEPIGLENNIECYISLLLRLVVLPGLRIMLKDVIFSLTQGAPDIFPQPVNVTLSSMPLSVAIPNNPAIEDNRVKVFIKGEVV